MYTFSLHCVLLLVCVLFYFWNTGEVFRQKAIENVWERGQGGEDPLKNDLKGD